MLNLFFMLRLFFFRRRRGFKKERSFSERVHLRECDDFILFFLLLYIAKLLCPKIVIFFGPFPEKKNTHREFFLLPQRCPPSSRNHIWALSLSLFTASSHSTLYLFYFLGRNEKNSIFSFFLALFIYKKIGMKAARWKGWHICTGRCEMKKNEKKLKMVYTGFLHFSLSFFNWIFSFVFFSRLIRRLRHHRDL